MRGIALSVAISIVLASAASLPATNEVTSTSVAPISVGGEEEAKWLRWVIPLPQSISIKEKIELSIREVGITYDENAGDIQRHAVSALGNLLKKYGNYHGKAFEIVVGLCDTEGRVGDAILPEAKKLASVPNSEQAYCISPLGQKRLIVTALTEQGLLYGVTTLKSLMEATLSNNRVSVPMANVIDWPDIAERGQWGGRTGDDDEKSTQTGVANDIECMASMKMNLLEVILRNYRVSGCGSGVGGVISPDVLDRARVNGIKYVPIVHHLDMLHLMGAYESCPEVAGQGESARAVQGKRWGPCTSSDKLVDIIVDWMTRLCANDPSVRDITCWLSEHGSVKCQCKSCTQNNVNQYVGETKAFLEAWKRVRRTYPRLHMTILLTQGSYKSNEKILSIIPPDVGVTYYHGGFTYDSSKNPMIYPALEEYAKKRWLGCYPILNSFCPMVIPWSCPHFIRYRSEEFFKKGLERVAWYPSSRDSRIYDLNFVAAAEWGWNNGGRSEREFALAWATRKGFKDPQAVASWATTLAPASWNLYGSKMLIWLHNGKMLKMLTGAVPQDDLGKGMFRYWKTIQDLDKDLAAVERALRIAELQDEQLLVTETLVAQGYMRMAKEILFLMRSVPKEGAANIETPEMKGSLENLAKACTQTTKSLRSWQELVGSRANLGRTRLNSTIATAKEAITALIDAIKKKGR